MRYIDQVHLTLESPYSDINLGALLDDAMIAGIPVPSLMTTLLIGLANGNVVELWNNWLNRQINDPEVTTTSYFTYSSIEPVDMYNELFDGLYRHFTKTANLLFINCGVVNLRILHLEEDALYVQYFVQYRHT